jgi:hypothetical protein
MKSYVLLWVLLAAAQAAFCAQGDNTEPAVAPTISDVRAQLFQNKTATWSEDVLDPKYGGLWNTIAGPGSSNAALVVVEVSGAAGGTYTGFFGPGTKYAVRLVAREVGRNAKVLDQSQTIPVLNDQGKAYLAFMVHQDGCKPVNLKVTVVGVGLRAGKPVERSLNFACGE